MRRLLRRRSSRAVIAALREDLREANGNLWKAANREFDLQCENRILRDVVAEAASREPENHGRKDAA
jgi:hypothetical protein